ncbi:mechanosensitive ion channel family protein [Actimicrobium antarcticum]|uniref:Small-conductance mechanosensitive channel n=1 Tax=Actimicrobium antarcticum TaxID=1051899 RepID=A0ABP7SM31_9BURK
MNEQLKHLLDVLPGYLLNYSLNVVGALITLIVGYLVAGWLARLIDRTMARSHKIDPVFRYIPGKIIRIAILIFTLVAVLNRFGVETTSLIAVLGAAGLAIGLALQGTLSNVAAGVMILFFRPFKIADVVQLDGQTYIIDAVGFFICRGHLPDGPAVFIPNSKIWGQTIVNLSVTDNDIRRIDENYGIAYSDDIGAALAILRQIAADEPRILDTPEPLIKVDKLGESSVNILFRVWTKRVDWWDTKIDLVQRCKEALEAGGCSLPFPQRDVHHFHEAAVVRKTGAIEG